MAVNPLQKVTQMLTDMLATGKQAKLQEEVDFAEFQQWCESSRAATATSIKQASAQIVQLEADITKAKSDTEALSADIEALEASASQKEAEQAKASAMRRKESADYETTHQELSESIGAVERAIAVLRARSPGYPLTLMQGGDWPQLPAQAKAMIEASLPRSGQGHLQDMGGAPPSLLQVRESLLGPAQARFVIDAYLQLGGQAAAVAKSDAVLEGQGSAPPGNAYESQLGGVVKILEALRLKLQDQKVQLEKEEANAKSNYEMLVQKLHDGLKAERASAQAKTAAKSKRMQDVADGKGELEATQKGKAEDEKKLGDTLAECHRRSGEFEKNQVLRAEEVKAIEAAVGILQSGSVSGSMLIQRTGVGVSLVQLRTSATDVPGEAEAQQRAAAFLQDRARRVGGRYLSLVAAHLSADPFAKVKRMMQDLIVKLMEQANAEADQKAYCLAEMATNKQTRENKQVEVEELSAEVDKGSADSAQLSQEVQQLSDEVAELRKEQAEATDMRKAEESKHAQTIADAKEAQIAVQHATKVLKDFYAKAADDTSMLQSDAVLHREMAQAARAPYGGMQSESGGVVGFLEVIMSDFARVQTETSSTEDQAQQDYEDYMADSTQDIALKEAERGHKEDRKQRMDAKTQRLRKELELTQSELDAALSYYNKLKPDCVDKGLSYEDRKRMREEEVSSLQQALRILDQTDSW